MKRAIGITAAWLSLAFGLGAAPVHAQLHGDWPSDPHWRDTSDLSSPRSEHMSSRAANNALGVPRGDLRKDVSDAYRDGLHNRSR